MNKPNIQEAIAEVRREVKLRERLYPQWIAAGRLSRALAERQLARMKYALELLEARKENPGGQAIPPQAPDSRQPGLFD